MKSKYENKEQIHFWIILGVLWLVGLALSIWFLITYSYGLGG